MCAQFIKSELIFLNNMYKYNSCFLKKLFPSKIGKGFARLFSYKPPDIGYFSPLDALKYLSPLFLHRVTQN